MPAPLVDPLLSVVVPVYNEEVFAEVLLRRVAAQPHRMEIIAVDDGSSDDTLAVLRRLEQELEPLRVLAHPQNRGKGAALRTGFADARGDVVIIQDADLEYDPKDYPVLLEPLLDGRADVVYGSRFLGGPHRVLYFHHYLGNKALTLLSNLATNLNLTDMETCYKVFRREVLDQLDLTSDRFGFEPEFTAQVAARRLAVYEVPISYSGRTYEEGKKITWRDGVEALWVILRAKRRAARLP